MKIGIYGGTFDPPHNGHIQAARAAIESLALGKLLVIPASTPPHKFLSDASPDAESRFRMTELAFGNIKEAEISDIEISRGGRSYTVDTITELKKKYPDDELHLLMGTDMILSFHQWWEFQRIIPLVTLCAFARQDGDNSSILSRLEELRRNYGAVTALVPNDAVNISSTEVREQLRNRAGLEYLPDSVYSYIISKRLYGAEPDLDWLREKSYAHLKEYRIPHVRGCEEEAARLAERWGADIVSAREAAILHDITKKEDLQGQLILCEEYGIMTDKVERESSALLHSITGAAVAKNVFGCSDEVVDAILWHTTGRENMTLLQKIIYIADYIEPTRDFEGLDKLRALAYEDLDRALLLGFQMSLSDMKNRNITPHPRTVRAMESIRDRIRGKG